MGLKYLTLPTLLGVFGGVLVRPAFAALEYNEFTVPFEVPADWLCLPYKNALRCWSKNSATQKEAALIVNVQKITPYDSMEQYEALFSKPTLPGGKVLSITKVSHVGATWVDARHLNGEVQGYTSRFLAAIHEGQAAAIQFIVLNEKAAQYEPIFSNTFRTFKFQQTFRLNPELAVSVSENKSNQTSKIQLNEEKSASATEVESAFPNAGDKGGNADRSVAGGSPEESEGWISKLNAAFGNDNFFLVVSLIAGGTLIFWIKNRQNRENDSDES